MNTRLEKMDVCMNPKTPVKEVIALLKDADWRVAMAAAVALGDRKDATAVPALVELLDREDKEPQLFTQTEDYSYQTFAGVCFALFGSPLPADTSEATALAWQRRGRLKQSAIWSLAAIGVADDAALLKRLQGYALDQKQDYMVRAASFRALGIFGDPSSRATFEKGMSDPEWCTMTEARKALAKIAMKN